MNRQTLKVEIKRILFLIEDSIKNEYDSDQLLKQLAKCLNYKLSDEEIEIYANWYLTDLAEDLGYTKESFEVAKEILEEFRIDYLQNKKD